MRDARSMGSREAVGNLRGNVETLAQRQPRSTERFTVDQLGDQEHRTVGGGANIVEREDVRVIERGDDFCLALDALASRRILCFIDRQQLEGDFASEPRIARAIHLPHASRTNRTEDFIGTNVGANGDREACLATHSPDFRMRSSVPRT